MLIYIISYFFYIDGVHTIISMSTSYGTNLGLDSAGMLLALLLVQVLGLPFCLLYMKLAEKFGARTMVGVGICVYMFICVFAFFMNSLWQFWVLAVLCATSQGGIQALSRSMSGKLIPDKDRSGEFFGFFDIFGKFSSIMGPALVGVVSSVVANGMLGAQGVTAQTATDGADRCDQRPVQPLRHFVHHYYHHCGRGAVLRLFAQSRARQAVNLTRYSIRITI